MKDQTETRSRACLKNHSCHLHAPLCVISVSNSGYIARYASFIWRKFSFELMARGFLSSMKMVINGPVLVYAPVKSRGNNSQCRARSGNSGHGGGLQDVKRWFCIPEQRSQETGGYRLHCWCEYKGRIYEMMPHIVIIVYV